MTVKEGKRMKNVLNGKIYEVTKISKEWVLLQAEDGLSQILTGKISLRFMYAWEGFKEESLRMIPAVN